MSAMKETREDRLYRIIEQLRARGVSADMAAKLAVDFIGEDRSPDLQVFETSDRELVE